MSVRRNGPHNTTQNVVAFVTDHLGRFEIDEGISDVNVRAKGFHVALFHSGTRPCTSVTIEYPGPSNRLEKKFIWVKRVQTPQDAFDKMYGAYKQLQPLGLHGHMPTPFCCDSDNDCIYTSRVFGSRLNIITLRHLLRVPKQPATFLCDIYRELGNWLRRFHVCMYTSRSLQFGDVLRKLRTAIANSDCFQASEKEVLQTKLSSIGKTIGDNHCLPLTSPHNDFSLRNILSDRHRNFWIVDWDAMVHPKFPREAPIWNDITCFLTNLYSMLRFSPFVSMKRISILKRSFLDGYLGEAEESAKTHHHELMWVFSLGYLVGLIGDRPLYKIYTSRLASRYIPFLKKYLLLKAKN